MFICFGQVRKCDFSNFISDRYSFRFCHGDLCEIQIDGERETCILMKSDFKTLLSVIKSSPVPSSVTVAST